MIIILLSRNGSHVLCKVASVSTKVSPFVVVLNAHCSMWMLLQQKTEGCLVPGPGAGAASPFGGFGGFGAASSSSPFALSQAPVKGLGVSQRDRA